NHVWNESRVQDDTKMIVTPYGWLNWLYSVNLEDRGMNWFTSLLGTVLKKFPAFKELISKFQETQKLQMSASLSMFFKLSNNIIENKENI
ncbi:hypothetical protein ACJX0J_014250, partial [Zea mays]